jgi:cytochrome c oxidase subunit 1
MPRRISDYPDAFAGWNLISSFGSIVSVSATYIFVYLLYKQLTTGKAVLKYIWKESKYFTDTLRILIDRCSNSIEWNLNSPPKAHPFIDLPLQSSVTGTLFFLKKNVINCL